MKLSEESKRRILDQVYVHEGHGSAHLSEEAREEGDRQAIRLMEQGKPPELAHDLGYTLGETAVRLWNEADRPRDGAGSDRAELTDAQLEADLPAGAIAMNFYVLDGGQVVRELETGGFEIYAGNGKWEQAPAEYSIEEAEITTPEAAGQAVDDYDAWAGRTPLPEGENTPTPP